MTKIWHFPYLPPPIRKKKVKTLSREHSPQPSPTKTLSKKTLSRERSPQPLSKPDPWKDIWERPKRLSRERSPQPPRRESQTGLRRGPRGSPSIPEPPRRGSRRSPSMPRAWVAEMASKAALASAATRRRRRGASTRQGLQLFIQPPNYETDFSQDCKLFNPAKINNKELVTAIKEQKIKLAGTEKELMLVNRDIDELKYHIKVVNRHINAGTYRGSQLGGSLREELKNKKPYIKRWEELCKEIKKIEDKIKKKENEFNILNQGFAQIKTKKKGLDGVSEWSLYDEGDELIDEGNAEAEGSVQVHGSDWKQYPEEEVWADHEWWFRRGEPVTNNDKNDAAHKSSSKSSLNSSSNSSSSSYSGASSPKATAAAAAAAALARLPTISKRPSGLSDEQRGGQGINIHKKNPKARRKLSHGKKRNETKKQGEVKKQGEAKKSKKKMKKNRGGKKSKKKIYRAGKRARTRGRSRV